MAGDRIDRVIAGQAEVRGIPERERRKILLGAAKQVAPAIFFSLLIIVVSFLPVFLLEAQEGRMFRPLAWTKTLAVGFSSLLAITLPLVGLAAVGAASAGVQPAPSRFVLLSASIDVPLAFSRTPIIRLYIPVL